MPFPPAVIEAAHRYLAHGWQVVPVPPGRKAPTVKGWQTLRLTVADLPRAFSNGAGVGLLLGASSRGLTDVDLDSPEAIALAELFLPHTDMIHGRPSKPKSHRWYTADPIPTPAKFEAPDGTCLVELRSTGQQTVVPPSPHPSGECFEWDADGDPARVDGRELAGAVARVAAAALVARCWPEPGSRHHCALALAGLLLRAGWNVEDVEHFVAVAAWAAGDEESEQRKADVQSTARRLHEDREATGGPTLEKWLGKKSLDRLRKWLRLRATRVANASGYRIEGGRLCREKHTRDGLVIEPLCNFVARVSEEIILDDGVETSRAFLIDGRLDTGEALAPVRVPASRFHGMTWVTDQWGLIAVVRAGQTIRDCLREAIQRLSPAVQHRRVFTHTGWREIDGKWVYLTASGAVGSGGFEVDLGSSARYALPRLLEDPVEAMRESLRLLEIAPLTVTAPLWAAVYRAPLAAAFPADLSLWLEGPTGSFKSTLAALFLAHWGDFTRTTLPGAWASTGNALEKLAFTLKDALVVIDDYAPTSQDVRELEAKAARILRAQGNLAGRARLRSDLTDRGSYPPRGLILATGEQRPPVQSLLARLLVIEIERDMVNLSALTEAQRSAARLPHALGGYVAWLAPQMAAGLGTCLREAFEDARAQATAGGEHFRVPEAVAHLWLGLDSGLLYAQSIGACSPEQAESLRDRCWDALLAAGRSQGRLVEEERPTRRFFRVLFTLLMQRRAVLLPKDLPEEELKDRPEFVGWYDEDRLYLNDEAAYAAVARFCREAGEPFVLRQYRLREALAKEGISECDSGRYLKTVRIGEKTPRVLCLHRARADHLAGGPLPPVATVAGSWT